jgi:uncharacterized protein
MRDEDVPAWWASLGLPGLTDIHVHFLPDRMMAAVWRYFDQAPDHYRVAWPIEYRTSDAQRVATLEALGVRTFPALVYPHRPDMAESLNAWARDFAARTHGCVSSGTFFPEPSATRYVREALDAGTKIFKVHVQVGGFDPADGQLDAVWGMLSDAAVPVVVHCGNGPIPGRHTGAQRFEAVLHRHAALTAVVAHCGMPEYAEHIALAERYPNVHLDTTMVGVPFTEEQMPLDRRLLPRLGALRERVVLGSDFPNIPYRYAEQLAALERFELGDDWLRAVCWHNGQRLIG